MVIALSPALISGGDWENHAELFMERLTGLEGVRLPGARRHRNRLDTGPRNINEALVKTIMELR
jgi:delta1-piperideine-2-carboxylate reductase